MELLLGEDWTVEPAGGTTGEAYIAWTGEQKLFLKRNSSPFLAVLSAEGIVPKLLWTKRLENGDVITAQRWVHGRELSASDMERSDVARLLSKIHSSSELLDMFKRIGNEPLTPSTMIENLNTRMLATGTSYSLFHEAIQYLVSNYQEVKAPSMVVCHCDINHNNWMINSHNELYLIDWDGATVADPAFDLGLLLYEYIPTDKWEAWLHHYGFPLTTNLKHRMHWYVVSHALDHALYYIHKGNEKQTLSWTEYLHQLLYDGKIE
ncbi:thiamine kinase-like enzyme [Salibacterium salarium]|uniref:phosphotransferase family protein n=1 Tax=Salibacterium salarium TaxID=284579 RepID=UPI002787BD12|nr:phosphotransferase family protein [Salibacterium salarium]MDQ0298517.1 thiamine kinase-like enzyme [Salibacterium salarium]